VDYERHRAQLKEITKDTTNLIDEKLPGRRKYNPETLKALPFAGISVIHNIHPAEVISLGLRSIFDRLRALIHTTGLVSKLAFVSSESLHATTFDLINEDDHARKLSDAGFAYQEVRDEVEQASMAFLRDRNLHITSQVSIVRIGLFSQGVVKLDLDLSKVAIEFQAYRRELNAYLYENVPGYCHVRSKDWNEELRGHITLAYIVNPLTDTETDLFIAILRDINATFQPVEFCLTPGEVTAFTDMDHYAPV
jgi:hypothetical protein